MKFNFEQAKEAIKKTAIGAGIITSSFGNLEAQESKTQEKEPIKTEVAADNTQEAEYYRNEYIKYMEHPSYKERLAKEMYGDKIIDEEKQANIDREYKQRLAQIKKVSIDIQENLTENANFRPQINKVYADKNAAYHELSHSIDFRKRQSVFEETKKNHYELKKDSLIEGGFNKTKEKYVSDPIKDYEEFIQSEQPKKYIENISLLHTILNDLSNKSNEKVMINFKLSNLSTSNIFDSNQTKNNKNINILDCVKDLENNGSYILLRNLNNKDLHEIYDSNKGLMRNIFDYENKMQELLLGIYYKENTEIKARLNSLRLKATNKFGFDLNEKFDINKFPGLKTESEYYDLKDNLKLSNKQINELMKYTAMNEERNKKNDYYHGEWNYDEEDNKA